MKISNTKFYKFYLNQINLIVYMYGDKVLTNRFLINWVDNLTHINIIDKFIDLMSLGRDSSSLNSHLIRYGEVDGRIRFKNKSDKCKHTLKNYIKRFGDIEGPKQWDMYRQSKVSYSLDAQVRRYGIIEGSKRWDEIRERKIKTHKHNANINRLNGIRNKNGRTLEDYQERYGLEDGYNRWVERNKKQSYRFSQNYYKNNFGKDWKIEYDKYLKSMDKTSKTAFINRYGEKKGIERYTQHLKKLSYCQSLEFYIDKYGDKIGQKRWEEIKIKQTQNFNTGYSKISQELFWSLYEQLDDKDRVYFAELNEEYKFYHTGDFKLLSVDFKYKNKIIEFYGDYWHANPNIFESKDIMKGGIIAEERWNLDKKRIDNLKSLGYDTLVVWESEYEDKESIIKKCIGFLNEAT